MCSGFYYQLSECTNIQHVVVFRVWRGENVLKQVEVFLLWNWFKREYFKFVHKVTHRVTTNSRGWGVTEKSIFQNLWKKEIDGVKKDIKQIYNFLQKHGFTDLKVKILILNADPIWFDFILSNSPELKAYVSYADDLLSGNILLSWLFQDR